jgi:CheY-like chemotaxis protein
VRLPLLVPRETRAGDGRRAEELSLRKPRARLRMLVVDDNVDAAESLRDFFVLLGHDVLVAHDAPGALRLVAECPPELALLDIGLPGMDGYELARQLRVVAPDAYLIAATGYGQETDRRAAREAGFDRHLVKPLSVDELETLVLEQELRRAADRARESLAGEPMRWAGGQNQDEA